MKLIKRKTKAALVWVDRNCTTTKYDWVKKEEERDNSSLKKRWYVIMYGFGGGDEETKKKDYLHC